MGNMGVGERVSLSKAEWDRLGFVNFQNNTDEKSRELKTIYVDSSGWFLKLMIHDNFRNANQNQYDQVEIHLSACSREAERQLLFIIQVGIVNIIATGYYLPEKDSDTSETDSEFFQKKRRQAERKKAEHDK